MQAIRGVSCHSKVMDVLKLTDSPDNHDNVQDFKGNCLLFCSKLYVEARGLISVSVLVYFNVLCLYYIVFAMVLN